MNYKVEKIVKNFKKGTIMYVIIWLILTILFVAPASISVTEMTKDLGAFNLVKFFEYFVPNVTNLSSFTKVLQAEYIGDFLQAELIFSLLLVVVIIIGLVKTAPKNEYTDIEHGSSDWSEGGEQYRILSKNKGIILAQNNYLPIDKRGNVNVLVVGRFWFW